jgi:protein disulfide-isomerase A6
VVSNSDIKIADLDATQASKLASKFGVTGYPTIKYFPKGSLTPEDYKGGRTADAIISWVNGKVGTNRKLDGSECSHRSHIRNIR